ncbi:metallophosphoesterase [Porphyromonas sp.]|uniref:metallophosphoesterase n=1 Tax=Porphyromonas sp. TaxID=1924944 RepID=UPI0026DCCC60|nr:metallophosphoesterase [Porphyromonas sp.]MDO4771646.1 metallophosphoesterase [Porphyromonas sp.]
MHVFLLSLIGQTIFNLLLILLLFKATKPRTLMRYIGLGSIAFEYVVFLILFALRSHLTQETIKYVLRIFNNYYVGLMIFLTFTAFVFLAIYIVSFLFREKEARRAIKKRWYKRVFIIMIPVTALLCVWGHYNTVSPRVIRHEIHLPRTANTPESLKIVFVSDPHIGEIISLKDIQRLRDMTRREDPDFVLLGGDILDYYTSYAYEPGVSEAMRELHRDQSKIFYVNGNHEYYHEREEKEAWFRTLGTFLKDSVVSLAPDVYLIGRDDHMNKERADLRSLKAAIPRDAVTIVLDHQPKNVVEEREEGVHLALHGHTHDGQFVPFKWVVSAAFEQSYGLYSEGGTTYCISSGYGVAASTFRVGTRSEIVVLTLVFDRE